MLVQPQSRLGGSVWTPAFAGVTNIYQPDKSFVIPVKQAVGLRELDLPPRKRGIQSLKHGERFDTLADRCCKHHTIGKGKRPNGEDAVPNGQQANRPKADLA